MATRPDSPPSPALGAESRALGTIPPPAATAARPAEPADPAAAAPADDGAEAYRAIFEHSMDGIVLTVPDGPVLAANPAACQLLQLDQQALVDRRRAELVDETDPGWQQALERRRLAGRSRAELRLRRADGSVFVADVSSVLFRTGAGAPRACVIFRDVTDRTELIEQQTQLVRDLYELSVADELTGLRNRRGLLAAGPELLAVADRQQVPVQALFLDVDQMKAINDRYGHGMGDAALVAVADAIRRSVRGWDLAVRLGGDEFVVLLLGADAAAGSRIAQRTAAELSRWRDGPAGGVTLSIGQASRAAGDPATIAELLAEADRRMYASRRRPLGG